MTRSRLGLPDLGVGAGLRVPHYRDILQRQPAVDFFEVISENFMLAGGKPRYHLEQIAERYPLVQHGVSLGIGSPEEPAREYLTALRDLADRTKSPWVSDHFCWCRAGGTELHDLLPLPYTPEAIERVVTRAKRIQDFLGRPLALENTSSYLTYRESCMPEWEFISEVAERADIGLMFDVNNVYVSAYNHDFDPYEFVRNVPHERIVQIHLAGHTNLGRYLLDTHSGPALDIVLDLYRETIELAGPVSTLIEWDEDIPPLDELLAEVERARAVRNGALAARTRRMAQGLDASAVPARPERYRIVREQDTKRASPGWKQGGPREGVAHEERS